jgi:aarF domain-containing kinase
MPLPLAQLQDLRDRLSDRLRPWSRSAEFWVRAADIYTSYKVRRARVRWLAASSCSISTSLRGAC